MDPPSAATSSADLLTRPFAEADSPAPPPGSLPAPVAPPAPPGLTSRRVKRNRRFWGVGLLVVLALILVVLVRGGGGHPAVAGQSHGGSGHPAKVPPTPAGNPRLDPDWKGDGQAVTFAFGGDVHFPVGTTLGDRLAADPSDALGPTVPALLSGVDLSMVNLESALTDGTCPQPQAKQYDFFAPASAISAFKGAGVSLITEANNHGEDCGPAGLQMALTTRAQTGYTILGIGQNAAQAFTPYTPTIHGQHIAIIAATQVIDSDLQAAWTATATPPGLASAYDVDDLVDAVEAARKTADTVVVYLHWGTELDACPNPLQEPLAQVLVQAGADVIVGTHAHVLLGGGYLGSAYVDYGLGNFAFYNTPAPTDQSGSLIVTATGRQIDSVAWRPALIEGELPVPLSGDEATQALAAWNSARTCTDLSSTDGTSLATPQTESSPAPAAAAATLSVDG